MKKQLYKVLICPGTKKISVLKFDVRGQSKAFYHVTPTDRPANFSRIYKSDIDKVKELTYVAGAYSQIVEWEDAIKDAEFELLQRCYLDARAAKEELDKRLSWLESAISKQEVPV